MLPANAGLGRHILEFPAAQVPVKFVFRIEAAEKQVAPAVAVVVARSNAGTVEINLVGRVALPGQAVDKTNPGRARSHRCETGPAVGRNS